MFNCYYQPSFSNNEEGPQNYERAPKIPLLNYMWPPNKEGANKTDKRQKPKLRKSSPKQPRKSHQNQPKFRKSSPAKQSRQHRNPSWENPLWIWEIQPKNLRNPTKTNPSLENPLQTKSSLRTSRQTKTNSVKNPSWENPLQTSIKSAKSPKTTQESKKIPPKPTQV